MEIGVSSKNIKIVGRRTKDDDVNVNLKLNMDETRNGLILEKKLSQIWLS